MPGTGKTFLISVLIKFLCENNQNILISCYTHTALDNILRRLIKLFPALSNSIVR
jgi:DNA replication ATP-dependent helicase Dna2